MNTAESEPSKRRWKTEPWIDAHRASLGLERKGTCEHMLRFPAMQLMERAEDIMEHSDKEERAEAIKLWGEAYRSFWEVRNATREEDGSYTSSPWKW